MDAFCTRHGELGWRVLDGAATEEEMLNLIRNGDITVSARVDDGSADQTGDR